jgi:hypothetical protein
MCVRENRILSLYSIDLAGKQNSLELKEKNTKADKSMGNSIADRKRANDDIKHFKNQRTVMKRIRRTLQSNTSSSSITFMNGSVLSEQLVSTLLEQQDLLIHVYTFLSIEELYSCSLCCRMFHEILFVESNASSSWIFKQLLFNTLKVTSGEHIENLEKEYAQLEHASWKTMFRNYTQLKFDSKYSHPYSALSSSGLQFLEHDRVMKNGDAGKVWEAAILACPMRPGTIHKWKFVVEQWGVTSNSYDIVAGVAIHDRSVATFNTDHDIVYIRDNNGGMGINLGLWEMRVGVNHLPFPDNTVPQPENMSEAAPFTVGFLFDYKKKKSPVLQIYFNDKLVTTMNAKKLNVIVCEPKIYYPTISICRHKTVRVIPWL